MKIKTYSFGKMTINNKTYTNDLKIINGQIKSNWWRNKGHELSVDDIDDIMEQKPEKLVIGTGNSGQMSVPNDVREEIKNKGIELIIKKTPKAVEEFNRIENTAGAFHLTC